MASLLKKELSKIKESTQDSTNSQVIKNAFTDLKVKLEEVKMIEESLREQLKEKKGYKWNWKMRLCHSERNCREKMSRRTLTRAQKY